MGTGQSENAFLKRSSEKQLKRNWERIFEKQGGTLKAVSFVSCTQRAQRYRNPLFSRSRSGTHFWIAFRERDRGTRFWEHDSGNVILGTNLETF